MSKMHYLSPGEILPPLPADLESAQKEIRRLQLQLHTQNEKMMASATKAMLDRKAAAGTIRTLREELDKIKAAYASYKKAVESLDRGE